jgi:glycerophosphoryl diester phosphodiesterase
MMNGRSHLPLVTNNVPSFPLILGHRGASANAPENTLAAFSRAIDDGAEGIEFDVRLSSDQVPVVIHDASLKRTGLIDCLVSELTAEELREIDVGSWFARVNSARHAVSYAGEKLPTLAQVFELFSLNSCLLYAEMKCDVDPRTALATAVVQLIHEFRMAERVVVDSFDLSAVAEIKRIDADIRTAALFEPKLSRPFSTVRRLKMVELAGQCGADEIALHYRLATARVIEKAKRAGLEIVLWTVDDPRWIERARLLGVKALIANDPARMLRYRDRLQSGL